MLIRNNRTNKVYFPERIIEGMGKITDHPLTIIEAPMGYGKSIAVKEALRASNLKNIWINIDDDSIGSIWEEICEGINSVHEKISKELLALGAPKDKQGRQEALNIIKKAKLDSKVVIILDGYHLMGNEPINKFVELLAMKEIVNLHIVLITRFMEMKSINELSAKGYLHHLTKEIFELRPLEIKKYYKFCGISLKDKEADQLFAITEGWYMGLYFLMESYNKNENIELTRNLYNLIENTIYTNESKEVKDFLLSVSFLKDFNINQAIEISGNQNAESIIKEIICKSGFLDYNEKTNMYHLHHIFAKYLQDGFNRKDIAFKREYYQRIANYHLKQGNHIEAMENYYKIGDFENLLYAVEEDKGHSIHIVNQECFVKYFEECPKALRQNHPIAILIYAICLFSFNEMDRFQQACSEFEEIIQRDKIQDGETLLALKGEYEVLLAFTKYNDINQMLEHIKKAAGLLKQSVKFLDTKSSWTFDSPSVLYMFYRESGNLYTHVQNLKEAVPIYSKLTDGHGSGSGFVMEAEYHFNIGDAESAEIILNKALYPANRSNQLDIVICALFLNARIALGKGDYDLALEIIQSMYKKLNTKNLRGLNYAIELSQGFLYGALGQYEKIPQWIREGDLDVHKLYFPTQPFYKIVYGRALLIHGEYLKILGICDELIGEASFYPNCLSQIYIQIYIAAANYQVHRFNDGRKAIKQALSIAGEDQIYMPFVENCDYIKPLLEEILGEGLYKKEIIGILEMYKSYRIKIEQIKKRNFSKCKPELTARETEIALLAANGMTNKEIGEHLFISTNTVKMALKSVFSKLDINNRALLNQYFS